MRTRIALVAIVPVALITVSSLGQAATEQSAQAEGPSPSRAKKATPVGISPDRLVAYRGLTSGAATTVTSKLPLDPNAALLSDHPAPVVMTPDRLVVYRGLTPGAPTTFTSSLPVDVNAALLSDHPATVVGVVAPAASPTSPTAASGPADTVTPSERAGWERVALCEEGGNWASSGPRFSGGLGISRANWRAFGGDQYAPEGALATEDQQIMVAERIESTPPDQAGCRGW